MILLDTTTRKLQVVLAGAKVTNDSPWVASYVDIAQSGFAMTGANSATGNSNGVTAVDIVAVPAASTTRQLKYFSLLNADTAAITVTIQYNDNATIRKMVTFILAVGQSLVYNAESGWIVQSYKAGQILGTATNDNAGAGFVGEFISSTVLGGASINLPNNTPTDITSISLSPGDWDVEGYAEQNPGVGCATTVLLGWTSAISATAPTRPNSGGVFLLAIAFTVGADAGFAIGRQRFSLATTTTIYLSMLATFTGGTNSGFGFIGARRVR